jgi:hypothetical protein
VTDIKVRLRGDTKNPTPFLVYPEGVSLPAVGLKTFSGLSTSRWADGNAGRDRTHVVLVPTFPILRAGESHNRKEKVSKLLETLDPGYPL